MRNNTLIKLIAVFALLTMIATSALADPTTDVVIMGHQHVYSDWVITIYPTCEDLGERVKVCTANNCSYHVREDLAVTGYCDYNPATCTAPQTCKWCEGTTGYSLGHNYMSATCVAPETCTRCGATTGGLGSHDYMPESCTEPMTCVICGITIGNPGGHQYNSATCQKPATCRVCGYTTGSKRDHNYVNNRCTMCGRQNVSINSSENEGDIE